MLHCAPHPPSHGVQRALQRGREKLELGLDSLYQILLQDYHFIQWIHMLTPTAIPCYYNFVALYYFRRSGIISDSHVSATRVSGMGPPLEEPHFLSSPPNASASAMW